MELNTITMPRAEARAAFLSYRRAVKARHDREDEQIMRGYRSLAQGKRVINLLEVVAAGGEDAAHRPKLAIIRADSKLCFMRRRGDGRVTFATDQSAAQGWGGRVRRDKRIELPADTLARVPGWKDYESVDAQAIVPNIPPALRPVHALSGYHILFEAEWRPVAPRDPALLKHLGGDLWAVLAVWNLTDLERAVLSARARA